MLAAYDCQVKKQQDENDRIKDDPEPYMHGDLARAPAFAADREHDEFSHALDYIGSKQYQ